MSNRIRKIEIHDRLQSPTEVELWVFVESDYVDAHTEVRGRLIGPTCPYADTVEVAYPLKRFPKSSPALSPLTRRVIVPEPSLWDPVTPFLYQGPIELWQNGELCERVQVTHGIRSAAISHRGLYWNGVRQSLRAVHCTDESEAGLQQLHKNGISALVVPGYVESLWLAASRLGLAIIGRTFEPNPAFLPATSLPSCLGWIIPAGAGNHWSDWQAWAADVHRRRRYLAIEIEQTPRQTLHNEIDFVIVPSQREVIVDRPRLVRSSDSTEGELGQLVISVNASAS